MKHDTYFEGKIQSLSLSEPEGPATVGVIEPGSCEFSTTTEERMSVVAGRMKVKPPGGAWREYGKSESFELPPKVKFQIAAEVDAAHVCRYR